MTRGAALVVAILLCVQAAGAGLMTARLMGEAAGHHPADAPLPIDPGGHPGLWALVLGVGTVALVAMVVAVAQGHRWVHALVAVAEVTMVVLVADGWLETRRVAAAVSAVVVLVLLGVEVSASRPPDATRA